MGAEIVIPAWAQAELDDFGLFRVRIEVRHKEPPKVKCKLKYRLVIFEIEFEIVTEIHVISRSPAGATFWLPENPLNLLVPKKSEQKCI